MHKNTQLDQPRSGADGAFSQSSLAKGAARSVELRKLRPKGAPHHPITSEQNYTSEQLEFIKAIDDYKRKNQRKFVSCTEVMAVMIGLGYRRPADMATQPGSPEQGN